MSDRSFNDAILLLVAHGSTVNADSARAAHGHAQVLRDLGLFREVRVAFWKQQPFIREAAAGLCAPRVFVVPLFLSEGYFTEQVIPRELGFISGDSFNPVQRRGSAIWLYSGPIGTDAGMSSVILARADEALRDAPAPPPPSETALFLAAHGTGKNSQSRRAAEWHRDTLREMGPFAEVHAVFLEEEPRISECPAIASAANIVVVPFFISDGLHAREDVPILLGEDPAAVQLRLSRGEPTWINPTVRFGKRIWCAGSIGTAPRVRDVIMARVAEAARLVE